MTDTEEAETSKPQTPPARRRRRIGLLEIDSFIDDGFYRLMNSMSGSFEGLRSFMNRFRVRGYRRIGIELLSDSLTFGFVGAVLAVLLALPAFDETETDWRTQDEFSVTFLDRYGNEIGKRGILLNDSIPLDEIPDHMVKAALATEDRRFYTHFGIDVFGTLRALVENVRAGGVVQGGSSITQQLAKNLFLTNERTLERKIKEAYLSIWLEFNLTKREILKLYLDRAYMGNGAFGVVAAAEVYFGKSVKELTLAESAMLAGLFKAPTKYAPHINLPAARARADEVLTNMVQAGFMTEGQVVAARRNPATPIDSSQVDAPDYFLDYAFDEVKQLAAGSTDRVLTVRTTIDTRLQQHAEATTQSFLRQFGASYKASEAAMVLREPEGAVRAMVGGSDYGESQFNRATQALRQPGSSFKPFVYATAMAHGYSPKSIVADAPISIGGWSPRNYTRSYSGNIPLTRALVKSVNTVPVRLAQAVGRDKIVDTAYRMGITSPLKITRSLPLGAAEVTVHDMAQAYAAFANGGYKAPSFAVRTIRNSRGEVIFERPEDTELTERVLAEETVQKMNSILVQIPQWGTARRAAIPNVPTAGKTGTTNAYVDAWFVGYTGNYVAAVWYGNDNNRPTARLTGGRLPAMTWQAVMAKAHENIEVKPIPYTEGSQFVPKLVARAETGKKPVRDPLLVDGSPSTLSPEASSVLEDLTSLMEQRAALETVSPNQTAGTLTPAEQNSNALTDLSLSGGAGLQDADIRRN
ncbi:transglycosylase domain-containing protein [Coralliovum pocilloporae]|uniref:transglycosylase domain-containing protein n=1 Tax=Coralliovum pocilloporae TaxID=3066369 RepID=UPI003D9C1652